MKQRPPLLNVTCSACTTPLLAFEKQKDGTTHMRSFGVDIDPTQTGPLFAICPKCGHREPFDRKLLPGT